MDAATRLAAAPRQNVTDRRHMIRGMADDGNTRAKCNRFCLHTSCTGQGKLWHRLILAILMVLVIVLSQGSLPPRGRGVRG
eukprot:364840-Chlamydomonas_euryale.AAC.5